MFIVLLILTISTKVSVGARVRKLVKLWPHGIDGSPGPGALVPFLMVPWGCGNWKLSEVEFSFMTSSKFLSACGRPGKDHSISRGHGIHGVPQESKDTNRNRQKQQNFNEMTLNSDAPQNLLTVRNSKEWFDVVRPLDNYGNDVSDGFQWKNWGSNCRVDFFWDLFFVSWMPQILTIQKTNPLSPHELGLKTRNRTPWLAGKIPHRHFHGVPVKKSPWLVRGIYRPCLSRFFRWWLCPCDPKKITIKLKPYMFPHESGFSVPKASAIWTKRPDTKRLERPGKAELAPKSMAKAVWEWSTWWMFMKFPYLLSLSLYLSL